MSKFTNPVDTSFRDQIREICARRLNQDKEIARDKMLALISKSININKGKMVSISELGGTETTIYSDTNKELCSFIRENISIIQGSYGFTYKYECLQRASWMGFSRNEGCVIKVSWDEQPKT